MLKGKNKGIVGENIRELRSKGLNERDAVINAARIDKQAEQADSSKIDKSVVLYMPASLLSHPKLGFKCGACMMGISDTSECTILRPAGIDLDHGVCGLFVPGKNTESDEHPAMKIVPKTVAGYSEEGPTHCGNCKYRHFEDETKPGTCKVVEGEIDFYGCCNHWEHNSPEKMY